MITKMIDTSGFLAEEELQLVRSEASKAEKQRRLTQPVLNLIYQKEWLKIMEPGSCGGGEWKLPEVVRLFEVLAYADGNLGWCVNLGAGANLFSGYFEERTAREIFSPSETWCAGSGAPTGKAVRARGGYYLTGQWKYASGSAHATHFTANAFLYDEQGNQITQLQKPEFRSFIVDRKDVKVLDTWKVSGLKATSSNEFKINGVFVPQEKVFQLTRPSSFARAPIFHFPFEAMAFVNMAAMPLGMALHFLELFENLMEEKKPLNSPGKLKENSKVRDTFSSLRSQLKQVRQEFYKELEEVWDSYEQNREADFNAPEDLKKRAASVAGIARKIICKLFPMCGMSIIYEEAELNKVWRDLNVAGQHYLLSDF